MEPMPGDYVVVLLIIAIGAGSLVTLVRLAAKLHSGRPILPYEPRRRVPWNGWAPLVMLAPLVSVWGRLLVGEAPADPSSTLIAGVTHATVRAIGAAPGAALYDALLLSAAQEFTGEPRPWFWLLILLQGVFTIAIALGGYLMIALAFKANREDLGLPTSWPQFWRDVRVGFAACIASMAPIWIILNVISRLTGTTEQHPMIRELMVNHSAGMMLAAAFTAIVAAPFYEETAFRLVFQGWLEKRFTPRAGRQPGFDLSEELPAEPLAAEVADAVPSAPHLINWPPILISGLVFGLAHLGHGASPAPLVLLGFVHGYLYQSTHRVVAPMACHMLFNSVTVAVLALHFGL
jgi:membrane protease YdiL (CAAX protease family)